MADPAATPAVPPVLPSSPKPKRAHRWPTAVVACLLTGLLTLTAAYLLERCVLTKQGWWVEHNRDRYPSYTHYFAAIYASNASAETKVRVTCLPSATESDHLYFGNRATEDWLYEGGRKLRCSRAEWFSAKGNVVADLAAQVLSNSRASAEDVSWALRLLLDLYLYWSDPVTRDGLYQFNHDFRGESDSDYMRRQGSWITSGQVISPLVRLSITPSLLPGHRRQLVRIWSVIGPRYTEDRADGAPADRFLSPADMLIASLSDDDRHTRILAARALGFARMNREMRKVKTALLERWPVALEANDIMEITEIIHSLGLLYTRDEDKDQAIRSMLMSILAAPRPSLPDTTRNHGALPDGDKPWYLDQCTRAEAILALRRLRVLNEPESDKLDAAVMSALEHWSPECQWLEYEKLAATVYLADCDHPKSAPTLLGTLRRVAETCAKEPRRADWWSNYVLSKARKRLIISLIDALSCHSPEASRVVSELITMDSTCQLSSGRSFTRFRVAANCDQSGWRGETMFHTPRRLWFSDGPWYAPANGEEDPRIPRDDWSLDDALARIGPPAKSDLPALRALLDYDGRGVTTDGGIIGSVRRHAAAALVRGATAGLRDPKRQVLDQIITDPAAHPRLVEAARVQLALLPPEGR